MCPVVVTRLFGLLTRRRAEWRHFSISSSCSCCCLAAKTSSHLFGLHVSCNSPTAAGAMSAAALSGLRWEWYKPFVVEASRIKFQVVPYSSCHHHVILLFFIVIFRGAALLLLLLLSLPSLSDYRFECLSTKLLRNMPRKKTWSTGQIAVEILSSSTLGTKDGSDAFHSNRPQYIDGTVRWLAILCQDRRRLERIPTTTGRVIVE